jgi:diacylglycerol O-acyltransferase / wax synthase
MAPSNLSRRMSAEDAWFLYFEKPEAPLHIGSVGIYEGTIPFEKMYASMDARMHLIPRYRQRAVIPPFFAGHPTWEDDPEFSLDRHLRLVTLPKPGTREQLIELSGELFEGMLPRDRPLWDITVIHGLEGDRTAYLSRVHHCLVDGVSGIELLLAVLDLVPDPEPTPAPAQPWQPKAPPSPLESWADAMFDQAGQHFRAFTEFQQRMLEPREQMQRIMKFARALEVVLPAAFKPLAKAPWNKPIGGKRRVAWTGMSFQEVRKIRGALGGTVNDVMLTILGGALGRYLRDQGVKTDGAALRLQIPVNVRRENEKGALGNRVSMMVPEIPVGIVDPVARLAAVRAEMERLKSQEQANAFEELLRLAQNLPAATHALIAMGGIPQGALNLICTNVPGPMIPLYSVGHRLLEHYPMVPLAADLGIGVGITSFDKGLYLGIMCDPQIVDDVHTVAEYAAAEFRALREAAGVSESDLPDIATPHRGHNGSNGASAPQPEPPPVPEQPSEKTTPVT